MGSLLLLPWPISLVHKSLPNQLALCQLHRSTMRSMTLHLLAGERQLLNQQLTMERLLHALPSLIPTQADRDTPKPVG